MVKRALCHLVQLWLPDLHKQGPESLARPHMQALTAHSERCISRVWLLSEIQKKMGKMTQDVQSKAGTQGQLHNSSTEGVRGCKAGGGGRGRGCSLSVRPGTRSSKDGVHALFCKACVPSLFGAPQTKRRQQFIVTAKALASPGQHHLQNSRLVCTWWSEGLTYTRGNPTVGGLKPWH